MIWQELKDDLRDHGIANDTDCPLAEVTRRVLDLYQPCSDCGGTGRDAVIERGGLLTKATWYPCSRCDGSGVRPTLIALQAYRSDPLNWLAEYLFGKETADV